TDLSCVKDGISEYWLGFDGTGYYLDRERTVEVTDADVYYHTDVLDEAKAPACTQEGLTEGRHCAACNRIIVAQEPIPALGHTDNNGDGYCERCTSLAQNVVDSGTCGTNATWDLGEDGTLYILGKGAITDPSSYIIYNNKYNNSKGVTIKNIVIGEGITSTCERAFYGCDSVESVVIPSSIICIGDNAFYACTKVSRVYISDIAKWCNIGFINEYANPLLYAHSLYLNNELVTNLEIPEGTTSIKDFAFFYCTSVQSVKIPTTITNIGFSAFSRCSNLNGVYISDIAKWCNINFDRRDANPLFEAEKLYLNDIDITELAIPDGVTTIKPYVFCGLENLISVAMSDSVIKIGESAFFGCSKLSHIQLSNSLEIICDKAFYDCVNIAEINIPNTVTTIGDYAFCDCSSLIRIIMPNSVTRIGERAFWVCENLIEVCYGGSEEDWKKISIGCDNPCLTNATIYYGAQVTSFTVNDTGNINLTVKNAPADAVICIVSCGSLGKGLEIQTLTLENETANATFKTDKVAKYKAFIWDKNLRPLAKPKEYIVK
ncbi:MAG: leucine-rich repeat domain-containing protein, partial [Clostridia bacterium]|nr:leucine-rich repeat domain-containing protein [Clostridia bacterium]